MPTKKELEKQLGELTKTVKHQAIIIGGMKGGKAGRGKSKARTSEQASAAVKERWWLWRERRRIKAMV